MDKITAIHLDGTVCDITLDTKDFVFEPIEIDSIEKPEKIEFTLKVANKDHQNIFDDIALKDITFMRFIASKIRQLLHKIRSH